MRIAAFSAMTMLAGFAAGYAITDPVNAAGAAIILIAAAFFAGLSFSGELT